MTDIYTFKQFTIYIKVATEILVVRGNDIALQLRHFRLDCWPNSTRLVKKSNFSGIFLTYNLPKLVER